MKLAASGELRERDDTVDVQLTCPFCRWKSERCRQYGARRDGSCRWRRRRFQVSVGTVDPDLSLYLSLFDVWQVTGLQRPFELVPREVLPDGQL